MSGLDCFRSAETTWQGYRAFKARAGVYRSRVILDYPSWLDEATKALRIDREVEVAWRYSQLTWDGHRQSFVGVLPPKYKRRMVVESQRARG